MALKPVTTPDVEAATIELTINGEAVTAREGVSLYDVIASTGKIIPAMCYHYTFDPFGSCGMCLVTQEGKKAPVRSCTAKATAGMVISTEGEDLFLARKKAVEKHLSVHPLDCPVCDADGHCELQDMAFLHGVTNLANAKQKNIPEDTRSLVLDFNMNRCIACGECINICKDVQKIDALQFMKKGGFTQVVPKGDQALECEFCGDCLAVCPVGAITNKFSKYAYKPWQLRKTTTTCNYCGDGCQMYVETKDTEVVRVTSPLSWKNKWGDRGDTVNGHGGLCVRGRFGFQFIDSADRIKVPLVRRDSGLTESPWIEALDLAAGRLAYVKSKYGAQAIAGLITARCTNEDLYLFQKFMRTVIGTNHVDSSARYGHLNFVRAMSDALGISRMMNKSEDLTKAKAVLLVGSNMTETNPVASLRIKAAIGTYKAQVIVVDSARTNMAKLASHPILVAPGTEGLLVKGLVKSVLDQDLIDTAETERFPEAFTALKQAAVQVSLDHIAERTGVELERIHEAARIFAEASRSVIICGEGLVRQSDGYYHVLNLVDLAWITGKLHKPGCGINTVTEEANEQGALDMGVAPEFLPGPASFSDADARAKFVQAWKCELPQAGANLMEILDRCRTGQIKALYLVGENPLGTLPASTGVKEALSQLEILICQDPFLTDTGRLSHIVFPACTFAEKDGTVTSQEGKVQFIRPALDPLGESALDWHIFVGIANAMGQPMEYEKTQEIQEEIRKMFPGGYYNLGHPKKVDVNPSSYFQNGYVAQVSSRYGKAAQKSGGARPFSLKTIQLLYHSGKLSTQASGLMEISPNTKALHMCPEDIAALGLEETGRVRVISDQGSVELNVRPDMSVLPGSCAWPEHFNDPPVKDLITLTVDPLTGVPYFKNAKVTIEKIG